MENTNNNGQLVGKCNKDRGFGGNGKINLSDFIQTPDGSVILAPKLQDFENIRITAEKDIPHHEPVIKMGGKGIASRKNITGISAQVKAGKTALCGVLQAGAISSTGEIDGFTGLEVEPNTEGGAVINIDTEQAEDDQQYNVKTVLKRAGLDHTPDYYLSYNFRQLNRANYQSSTDAICLAANEKFGDIHLLIFDGGADFCLSVNDDKIAADVVEYFSHLSINYDCPVIIVVHQNPGSDKERGHFGSEVQRKCYGLISITKTGDVSTAAVKIGRKAGTTDTPLLHYRYDELKGYHVQVAEPDAENDKAVRNRQKHEEVAKQVFIKGMGFKHNDAVRKIMDVKSCSEKTAKTMLQNMVGWKQVEHKNEFYKLNAGVRVIRGKTG